MKKTPSILMTCLLGMLLLTTACGPQQSKSKHRNNLPLGGKPTIGLSNCCEKGLVATVDQYVTAVEKEVQKQGGKMISLTANENQTQKDPDMQFNQVKQLIDKGAKSVIVVFVSDRETADNQMKIIEYAEQKNVAIIAGRRAIPQKLFTRFNNLYSITVSPSLLGMQQGRMVVEQWQKNAAWDKNEDQKMSFAMLKGPAEAAQAKTRVDNALNAIRQDERMVGSELVLSAHSGWKIEDAEKVVASWIKSGEIDKIEVIVANSDELALGAIKALKTADKPLLPIFGINASPAGLESIQNNELMGSILPDSATMGALTYQTAENLAIGKNVDAKLPVNYQFKDGRVINVQPIMVTKENVHQVK